jgi:hypothetical protein
LKILFSFLECKIVFDYWWGGQLEKTTTGSVISTKLKLFIIAAVKMGSDGWFFISLGTILRSTHAMSTQVNEVIYHLKMLKNF